ncbi:hypothetical protein [Nocardiopsis synnemataformans]|uniref:hypothetical protein n=1 Tax=Nocardiopsis synnemataformans TaxID=61305 RepID=UPI003EBB8937
MLAQVGAWAAAQVLGPVTTVLAGRAPRVVHVVLPPGSDRITLLPLEAASVHGKALSLHGVTFVHASEGPRPGPAAAVEGPVRMLAVFSPLRDTPP